jgi:chaperone required for assembly of F1-ATPase
MSEWAARRFWKTVSVDPVDAAFEVRLDGRPIRTPAKSRLLLPTADLARAVALEWEAQEDTVDPGTMVFTRMANSAIDKVTPRFDEVVAHLVGYGETDLVCYRATHPEALLRRQEEAWDPWISWAQSALGARLVSTKGVIPVPQDPAALASFSAAISGYSAFEVAALHDLVGLSGSLVLGVATAMEAERPEVLWETALVDEIWQVEQWGEDDEATRVAALKKAAFLDAARFLQFARKKG